MCSPFTTRTRDKGRLLGKGSAPDPQAQGKGRAPGDGFMWASFFIERRLMFILQIKSVESGAGCKVR